MSLILLFSSKKKKNWQIKFGLTFYFFCRAWFWMAKIQLTFMAMEALKFPSNRHSVFPDQFSLKIWVDYLQLLTSEVEGKFQLSILFLGIGVGGENLKILQTCLLILVVRDVANSGEMLIHQVYNYNFLHKTNLFSTPIFPSWHIFSQSYFHLLLLATKTPHPDICFAACTQTQSL